MFELSNEVSILKTRIRQLELRKERLMAASLSSDTQYWVSSDLERIETQLAEARQQLADKESAE